MADNQFDVLLTVDRGIPFQQNLGKRKISILLLVGRNNRIETLEQLIPQALAALETLQPGTVIRIGE